MPDLAGLVTAARRTVHGLASPRVAWRGDGRVHIRVRGITHERGRALARAVEARLTDHSAVRWAVVNAPLGVAVVSCAGDAPAHELIAIIERLEAEYLVQPERPADRPAAVDRVAVTAAPVAVAAAGLAFAGVGRVLRIVRLPAELGSVVQLVDTQPRLRAAMERAAGAPGADLALATANALAQSAAQGVSGLALDLGQRAAQLAEAVLQRDTWSRAEPALCGDPRRAAAQPVTPERPRPLPPSPAEMYAEKVGLGALGAFGGLLAVTGSPQRAAGVALAGLPKAARVGPEGFAAALGCLLARRGLVVTDHRALRLLDRIDTIVIDTDVLTTGALAVGNVLPLVDADIARLTGVVYTLFSADRVSETVTDGTFALGPLRAHGMPRGGARLAAKLADRGAAFVLGLTECGRLRAVVGIAPEPAGGADLVLAAAAGAGAAFCLAGPAGPAMASGPSAAAESGPGAARHLPGGRRLLASVRGLQADGAVVLLVSGQRRALAAADVGVGLASADGRPAWGAHILAAADLAAASLPIDAVRVARAVSGRGVRLSQAGTALGAAIAAGGAAPTASARSLLAVNGAGAIALAGGAWSVSELARRPARVPPPAPPWHAMPADLVLSRVASRAGGLSEDDARRRWRPDERQPREPSVWRAFLTELANPLTPILGGGAALSASIGAVADAVIVSGVCALSALMGGAQRVYTERSMARLLQASAVTARVLRDGSERTVPAAGLVGGDVVLLAAGDIVPADCRLLDAQALQVDESPLTGESVPVDKTTAPVVADMIADRRSMLYEGTVIAAGRARAVVVATGAATEMGRSLAALSAAAPVTGVEARLSQITRTTLPIALGSAVAVVGAGLLRGHPARDTIGAAVGLAVASVPEGLPFLVTAAQLASARRLAGRGALVRNPRTIEALGRVNVLCFDKTGTLTQGRMALAAVSDGAAIRPMSAIREAHRQVLAAALRATPAVRGGRRAEHLTDQAVTDSASARQVTRSDGQPGWRLVDALPFEPSRAFHATLASTRQGPLLSVKGAPEVVVPRCTRWRGRSLGARDRRRLSAQLDRLAQDGYRVLAIAESHVGARYRLDGQADGMTFAGFVAFGDPVRRTAGVSVRELREAGIHVVMITGDHPATATAIATELDVLNGGSVVTGAELNRIDDAALPRALAGATVIARCTPEHKVRIVRAFQAAGRVVAMTGDGANDAAAIRLADVGIALGRRGTPAARAAADLVVSDDRLETITSAIVEGRGMWRSVRQAVGILVGGNIGEIGYTLLGTLLSGTSPLSARQLLLVNLFTDLVPALTVALRMPPPETAGRLLAEGPDTSLGSALTEEIAIRATATGAAASGAWLVARMTGSPARARTVGLIAVIGTELGQTLLVGGRSPAVAVASLASFGMLVFVVQTPGVSQFFGCRPVGPVGWSIAAVSAATGTAGSLLLPTAGRALSPVIRSLASSGPARQAGSVLAGIGARAAQPAQAGPRRDRPPGERHREPVPAASR
jgi:cation-transporting P-type ATPase I